MTLIQKFKNGRLHIYVRQDMYKGKLKSENWVGRTFLDKKQRVFSSGTKNFEEAKIILEKWYDDLESGVLDQKNEENTPLSEIPSDSTPAQVAPLEPDNKVAENTVIEKIIKPEEDGAKSSSVLDKIKNAKFGLSFFKKTNSEVGQNKSTNKLRNKFKEIFSEKISRASVSGEEIAGIDISPDSIRVAQITKQGESWILDKVSTRLLQKDQVNNNILEAKDYVSEEIKLALANAKITTSNVAISVPVTSAIIRVVSSPLMSEEELQRAIETDSLWENLVQLTDNLNDYSVFHQVISRNSKNNTMEILFVASKLSDVNAYSSIVKKAGLNPVIMDVKCFTLKNAFDNSQSSENKSQTALLEVGIEDNYLLIVHNNMPIITDIFLRPHEKEALLNIKNSISNDEADTIIRRFGMQLKQALNEYETKYNNKINNLKVISSLQNIEDIIISLKKNLPNTGFNLFDPFKEMQIPKYNEEKTSLENRSIYTSVIGLAYRKLDVFGYYKFVTAVKNINLLPNREALKRQNKLKFLSGFAFKGFAAGIAAIYFLLIGYSFFEISSNKNKLEAYEQIQTEFNEINIQHSKLRKQSSEMRGALRLGKLVNSNQSFSYRALNQITRSVPQRVTFSTLDFNGSDQIIITGLAFSDQDIINFISNLNNKSLIALASLQAMNVPQKDGDMQAANNKKGFTIMCKLKTT
ncbi:MAG: pilus assembly protein PilM [Candidatus Puniceispirillales bacterium]|jgi:type IV pilus assembly protein PilN|tara:strand:- start:1393 stop:3474 length:2082 start_codon:yes stop_codon:yes gene_type:complete